MEFACRAEAGTAWCFGQAEELLPKYGWYTKNSGGRSWPVGSLKPNDFGVFDVHGSVWNWCQDRYGAYPRPLAGEAVDDKENNLGINIDGREVHGGSFSCNASFARSASRNGSVPATRSHDVGFRPARTFSP
jgi:formylglycine-generating enzyme required for sulfatase activity